MKLPLPPLVPGRLNRIQSIDDNAYPARLQQLLTYLSPDGVSPELRKRLADLTDSESARRQMKNLFYIHANLAEEKDPRIVLKFPLNYVEVKIYDIQIVNIPNVPYPYTYRSCESAALWILRKFS